MPFAERVFEQHRIRIQKLILNLLESERLGLCDGMYVVVALSYRMDGKDGVYTSEPRLIMARRMSVDATELSPCKDAPPADR